jgi:hypothetical protein
MNNIHFAMIVAVIGLGGLMPFGLVSAAGGGTTGQNHNIRTEQLQRELAELRRMTGRYQKVKEALRDGYVGPGPFVPFMGLHYIKPELLGDGVINVYQPEALVYDSNDPQQQTRNLGAVEYLVADPEGLIAQSDLPVLFTGQTTRDWHYEDAAGVWTLHVWIWIDNPEGLFHSTNPRVGRAP